MRNNCLTGSILFLLFGMVFTSCKDDEKFSLELNKPSLTFGVKGGEESLVITSNGYWEIESVPEWLFIDPSYGFGSAEIEILARENSEFQRKKETLRFICENITRELDVEQLSREDSFLELDAVGLWAGPHSFTHTLQLTTNKPWQLKDVPSWITASPLSGNGSAEITLLGQENRDLERRSAILTFEGEELTDTYGVQQYGLSEVMRSPGLPIFSYSKLSYTSTWEDYEVEANTLFINPEIREKIYLGNLVGHTPPSNTTIPEFTGYTFNPITVSTSAPIPPPVWKTFTPSWEEQDKFAQEIIALQPRQEVSFVKDDGTTEFYDYRRLHTLGIINLGVKLDELVSGSSFREKQKSDKYGLIWSFKRISFTLDMNVPEQVIKEELREEDAAQGVSFVSLVKYGRVGLLIMESDTDSKETRIAINKVLAGESLSGAESTLIQAADISYVYFNNIGEVRIQKGHMDAIEAYKKGMTEEKENIYPVEFGVTNFSPQSSRTLSFSLKITD